MNKTIFITPENTTELIPACATAAPINHRPVYERSWKADPPPCNEIPYNCGYKRRGNNCQIQNIRIYNTFSDSMCYFNGKTVNAIKLKKAAIITAAKGERTFVETTVANGVC